jgi:hypothetical protein
MTPGVEECRSLHVNDKDQEECGEKTHYAEHNDSEWRLHFSQTQGERGWSDEGAPVER